MKSQAIAIAMVFAGFAGVAVAGSDQTMSPVYVSPAGVQACTPPSDAPVCENLHRLIRANFSEREIGMLFGARTSYPESLTGGFERLQKRYRTLVHEYAVEQIAAHDPIAVK